MDLRFITANPATEAYQRGQVLSQQQLAQQQQQDQIQRQDTIQNATLPTQLRQMTAGADLAQTNAGVAAATAPAHISEANSNATTAGVNAQFAAPVAQAGLRQANATAKNAEMASFYKSLDLANSGQMDAAKAVDPKIPDAVLQSAEMRNFVTTIAQRAKELYPERPELQQQFIHAQMEAHAQQAQAGQPANPQTQAYSMPEGAPAVPDSNAKPINVPYGGALVDPKTHQPVYQNTGDIQPQAPGATQLQGEDFLKTLAPRDAQLAKGLATYDINPMALSTKGGERERAIANAKTFDPTYDQTRYTAKAAGAGAGARTGATREANLNLILRAAEAAIPAALEMSEKVTRYAGGFVPLNKIIQRGQVMTSDANLRAFGMANLQLAEHWARAMNPTGVMRESDRDKALEFLSTADSAPTYKQLVMQLHTQIKRERDAVAGPQGGGGPQTPAPGATEGQGGAAAADHSSLSDDDLKRKLGL